MQVTNVRDTVDYRLTIQLQQQAQYTMRAGMLGTHIQDHCLAF
jgi:hypothetical protein